jgi:hypothetical protein
MCEIEALRTLSFSRAFSPASAAMVLGAFVAVACGSSGSNGAPPADGGPPDISALFDAGADVVPASPAPDPVWRKVFGDAARQRAYVIAVSPDGHSTVGGSFQSSIDFGTGPLAGAGSASSLAQDSFVATFDADGRALWSRAIASAHNDSGGGPLAVDVRADGHVAVAGGFTTKVSFGGADLVSAGDVDAFVALLDASGKEVWSKRYGSTNTDDAAAVTFMPDGGVVVAGSFSGTVDFGGGPVTASENEVFVVRLDAAGAYVWGAHVRGLFTVNRIASSAAGDVVLVGSSYGTGGPDFGGGALGGTSGNPLVIAALGPTGAYRWGKRVENPGDAFPESMDVRISPSNDVYVAEIFHGASLDFGVPSPPGTDGTVIAKIDLASGSIGSLRRYGAEDGSHARLAFDADGKIILLHGQKDGSPVLERIDPTSGASLVVWGLGRESPAAVAVDGAGSVFIAGAVDGAQGYDDVLVSRYPPLR